MKYSSFVFLDNADKNTITRIVKWDLVRKPNFTERSPLSRDKFKLWRDSTIDPIIRSISEYDHNNPLTDNRTRTHLRGKSHTTHMTPKANIISKLGNLDDALHKAQTLLENKPKDHNYLYLKGRILEKLARTNEAEKWFKEALDIHPKFAQAAFYLAAIENQRGNFEKSIELYNYALSKDQIPKLNSKSTTPIAILDSTGKAKTSRVTHLQELEDFTDRLDQCREKEVRHLVRLN